MSTNSSSTDSPSAQDHPVFADDPIHAGGDDRLGRGPFAKRIVEVLRTTSLRTRSAVLALIGAWGSGKSSLLNLTTQQLALDPSWSVVEFNPWELSSVDSLMHAFFEALAEAMPDEHQGEKVRGTISEYARKLLPLVSATSGVLEKVVDGVTRAIEPDMSLKARRKKLEAILEASPVKFVVVLDDLDRLMPEELLIVFKLVRLVGRLPNVYYLLAYDEETLLAVLRETAIARGSAERALSYLEKIVQIRLDIPRPHGLHALQMVEAALAASRAQVSEQRDPAANDRLIALYQHALSRKITEPRSIKRYFAQVDAFYPLVDGEVDFVDFAALTFLRTLYPRVYRALGDRKSDLTSTSTIGPASQFAVNQSWHKWIAEIGVSNEDAPIVASVLAGMFPPVRAALSFGQVSQGTVAMLTRHKRIGAAEYFDRYFQLGVPPGDVSDSLIETAVREIGVEGAASVVKLRAALLANQEVVLRKLQAFPGPMTGNQRAQLIELLAGCFSSLTSTASLIMSPRSLSVFVAAQWLVEGTHDAAELLIGQEIPPDGIEFVAQTIRIACRTLRDQGTAVPDALNALAHYYAPKVAEVLELESQKSLELDPGVLDLLAAWIEISGGDEPRAWLRDHLDKSAWTTVDLAASCVEVWTGNGGATLGNLNWERLSQFADPEEVTTKILAQAAGAIETSSIDDRSATFENRRRFAVATIVKRRDSRASSVATEPPESPNDANAGVGNPKVDTPAS